MRVLLGLLIALMLITMVPTGPASTASRVAYRGPAPLGFTSPAQECDPALPNSLGVVCVSLPLKAREVTFSVDDRSQLAVGGTYYLYDAAGNYAGQGSHCNGATIAVPSGGLAILRLELVNGPLTCLAQGISTAGEATKGFVTYTIH